MKYEIVSIDLLKPLEKVFPSHLKNLEDMIIKDGFVLRAIIADKKTGTILDGSHRYAFFLKSGYKEIPVFWVDYDDENIRVGTTLSHRFLVDDNLSIKKEDCRKRALSGNLFDPRTTRHFFAFRKSDISLPLNALTKKNPVNIDYLIADVDVSFEIEHNKKFIREINHEIEAIVKYLEEVFQTKKYLTEQVDKMDESRDVVFFPGKFHPPHIGQIQTILNIIPKYKKVIIGVSEDTPENIIAHPKEIAKAMTDLFKNFDNVEIVMLKGVLVEKRDLKGLPNFDILFSGNPDVLTWAEKVGIKNRYIPRSFGKFCSGTEVRNVLTNK